jgi:cytochrome c oxidase subunit 2
MILFDLATHSSMNFQDPASPIAEAIGDLHHTIFTVILVIATLVIYLLGSLLKNFYYNWEYPTMITKDYLQTVNLVHSSLLETVWTIIPSVVLMVIAVPSFSLLYAMDEVINPTLTVKAIAHQWYWTYEYGQVSDNPKSPLDNSEGEGRNWDSYMTPTTELSEGDSRLLEVDKPMILPVDTQIRILVTSTDVLHAFSVNSLGVKVDAVPGRLNQLSTFIKRPGTFYGQCSELCGTNHAFMPIVVKAYEPQQWTTLVTVIAK